MVTTDPSIKAEYQRLREAAATFGFHQEAALIDSRKNSLTQPFLLFIMGKPGTGKSSLINLMLGRHLSPIGRSISWLNIYRRARNNREYAEVTLAGNSTPELMPLPQAQRLMQGDPGFPAQNIERIVWHLQTALLPGHVALAEAPNMEPSVLAQRYSWEADGLIVMLRGDQLNLRSTQEYLTEADAHKFVDIASLGVLTYMDRIPRNRWMRVLQQARSTYGDQLDMLAPCTFEPDELALAIENPNDILLREIRNRFYTSADRIRTRNRSEFISSMAQTISGQFEEYVDRVLENRWACYQFNSAIDNELNQLALAAQDKITAYLEDRGHLQPTHPAYSPGESIAELNERFETDIRAFLAHHTQRIFSQLRFNEKPMDSLQQDHLPLLTPAGGDGAAEDPPPISFRLPDLPMDALQPVSEMNPYAFQTEARTYIPQPPADAASDPFADPFDEPLSELQPVGDALLTDPFSSGDLSDDPFSEPRP